MSVLSMLEDLCSDQEAFYVIMHAVKGDQAPKPEAI